MVGNKNARKGATWVSGASDILYIHTFPTVFIHNFCFFALMLKFTANKRMEKNKVKVSLNTQVGIEKN